MSVQTVKRTNHHMTAGSGNHIQPHHPSAGKNTTRREICTVVEEVVHKDMQNKPKDRRTLILFDATGSMGGLIQNLKDTMSETLTRVDSIIRGTEHKGKYWIRVGCYRNYNDGKDRIFQLSKWENNAKGLLEFLSTVQARGGNDTKADEAVEVALQYATLNQHKHHDID